MSTKRNAILATLIVLGLLALTAISYLPSASADNGPAAGTISTPPVQYASVNNVTLGYRSYGSGEPLLLLCGFGATMDNWSEPFINILATEYHVFAYDHRGMGYSGYGNTPSSIQQYADDAVALMHFLGYASMNTYGTSMGSTISEQLVLSHPEAARKMVFSSATYDVRIPECLSLIHISEPTRPY